MRMRRGATESKQPATKGDCDTGSIRKLEVKGLLLPQSCGQQVAGAEREGTQDGSSEFHVQQAGGL